MNGDRRSSRQARETNDERERERERERRVAVRRKPRAQAKG